MAANDELKAFADAVTAAERLNAPWLEHVGEMLAETGMPMERTMEHVTALARIHNLSTLTSDMAAYKPGIKAMPGGKKERRREQLKAAADYVNRSRGLK